jgi:phage gp36-like protein
MSAYCAEADMQARYATRLLIQLTDLPTDDAAPPATTITAAVLNQAIADTSAEIDSNLSVVYSLPLVGDTPPALLDVACKLTLARLYERNALAVPDHVTSSASAARSWLKRLAAGEVRLYATQLVDDATRQAEGAGMPQTNDLHREFTMRNLKDVL